MRSEEQKLLAQLIRRGRTGRRYREQDDMCQHRMAARLDDDRRRQSRTQRQQRWLVPSAAEHGLPALHEPASEPFTLTSSSWTTTSATGTTGATRAASTSASPGEDSNSASVLHG